MYMKKMLWGFAAALALLSGAPAQASPSYSPTFVVIATFTATGQGTIPFGFKNASSAVDVKVQKVEVFNCSTHTVSGGVMLYNIIPSTTITAGTVVQVSTYSLDRNFTYPLNVQASISPTTVVFETKQSSQLPFFRPLYLNNDDAATTMLSDSWNAREGNDEPQALVFLRSENRGFVLKQEHFGVGEGTSGDIVAGCVGVRVMFNAKAY